jgi:hypothetical protein
VVFVPAPGFSPFCRFPVNGSSATLLAVNRGLLQVVFCAFLLTLTSSPAWGICRPENRVGGSPTFSPNFTFPDSANPVAASGVNPGCGYDFASGVHKYLYAEDDPVDNVDPLAEDVYKVVEYGKNDAVFGLAHHRLIVGDDGNGGSYIVEVGGNGLSSIRSAYISYYPDPKLTAAAVVSRHTAGATLAKRHSTGGYIAGYVPTVPSVDAALNKGASALNGKPSNYIFLWNDCGTFANEWLVTSERAEIYAAYPYFPASTGGVNYVDGITITFDSMSGF